MNPEPTANEWDAHIASSLASLPLGLKHFGCWIPTAAHAKSFFEQLGWVFPELESVIVYVHVARKAMEENIREHRAFERVGGRDEGVLFEEGRGEDGRGGAEVGVEGCGVADWSVPRDDAAE